MPTVKVNGVDHWVLTTGCAICGDKDSPHFVEDGFFCFDCNDYHNCFFCDECLEYASTHDFKSVQ